MAGTVITISPRVSLADAERLARSRLARDGMVEFAAAVADGRQLAHLRRLWTRLVDDPGLMVFYADRLDGAVYLTLFNAGQRPPVGWFGDAKIDRPDDGADGDHWSVPDPDSA